MSDRTGNILAFLGIVVFVVSLLGVTTVLIKQLKGPCKDEGHRWNCIVRKI